ncbi:MAG: RNA-binding protein [Nitrospira sp.]|jgi:RNA recognition motif-containing protein|nr:RNA-binding protein [Nitrospira sp. CR1.1]MCS6326999.1 RNA-binding protein [Nitrospira sp.]
MATLLFVEGFPEAFTDQDLYNLFAVHGRVISARVVRDLRQESLRYGFVEVASNALHRTWLEGNSLIVSFSQ